MWALEILWIVEDFIMHRAHEDNLFVMQWVGLFIQRWWDAFEVHDVQFPHDSNVNLDFISDIPCSDWHSRFYPSSGPAHRLPPADVLAYGSTVPKRKRRKAGRLPDNALEVLAEAKENIMAIVERVDSELHLGGPDGVWHAMGLTRRSEKSSQVWNAFQSRHAVLEARDPDTAADVYKATVKAGFEAWKSEGKALDPEAQTQRESELIAWHNQHLLEKEVASTHLPGGRMKQMLKIQSRLGEDATLNLLNLGIFTVSFVVNVSLGDVEATEANAVVHPSKLSHKLFSEKHLHIQEYLNTLAGGLAAEMEDIRHHEAVEALLSKRWWTTVQRDQRENISKFLVNMWSTSDVLKRYDIRY
ncbi:hypothetical protein BS47DRAFT_1403179 [Hydnum rufescens UP504]|uniref:Uncharacterized protein n=1 Tax=Hydnum rufescens UP504 TaxID=1448309 RepID=A0A9P6DKX1_9AGAM|nr:hypothetical protein BS47DRAFT_1403179 [Hydnum rufescens UP504]